MGQRERSGLIAILVVVGFCAGVARAADPAPPSNDDGHGVQPSGALPAAEESPLPFALGIGVGYGFRPHADGRNHGGSAHLYGDIPLGLGFGVRPELLGFSYAPSDDSGRPLAHPLAAGSLVYAFDDTDAVAVVGVGGFVGFPLEIDLGPAAGVGSAGLSGGVLLSLGLRFRVLDGLRAEAGIRVPIALVQPPAPPGSDELDDLRSQIGLSGGLVLVPSDLWRAYVED